MARHLSSVIRTAANDQRHNSPLLAYKVLNLHIYVKVYTGSQSSTQQQSRTATNTTKTLLHSEIATTSEPATAGRQKHCRPEAEIPRPAGTSVADLPHLLRRQQLQVDTSVADQKPPTTHQPHLRRQQLQVDTSMADQKPSTTHQSHPRWQQLQVDASVAD